MRLAAGLLVHWRFARGWEPLAWLVRSDTSLSMLGQQATFRAPFRRWHLLRLSVFVHKAVTLAAGLFVHQWLCMGLGAASLAGVQRDSAPQYPVGRPEHHHLCAAHGGRHCRADLPQYALLHEIRYATRSVLCHALQSSMQYTIVRLQTVNMLTRFWASVNTACMSWSFCFRL